MPKVESSGEVEVVIMNVDKPTANLIINEAQKRDDITDIGLKFID